jgi:hypothetical protein
MERRVAGQVGPDRGCRAGDLEAGAQAQRRFGEEGLIDGLAFEPGSDRARLSRWRPIRSDIDAAGDDGR